MSPVQEQDHSLQYVVVFHGIDCHIFRFMIFMYHVMRVIRWFLFPLFLVPGLTIPAIIAVLSLSIGFLTSVWSRWRIVAFDPATSTLTMTLRDGVSGSDLFRIF